MLLYGLPTKAATRHAIAPIINQCIVTRAEQGMPSTSGLFLTLVEELLLVSDALTCGIIRHYCGALSMPVSISESPHFCSCTYQMHALLLLCYARKQKDWHAITVACQFFCLHDISE